MDQQNFTKLYEKYLFIKPYYRNDKELFELIEDSIDGEYILYENLDRGRKIELYHYLKDIEDEYGDLKLKIYKLKRNSKNEKFFVDEKANQETEFSYILLEENSGFIYANQNLLFLWLSISRGISDEEFKTGHQRVAEYYFHLRCFFQIYDDKVF